MTFDPILNAPVYLQLHAATALIALCLGPVALYRKRRNIWHKAIGYVWMDAGHGRHRDHIILDPRNYGRWVHEPRSCFRLFEPRNGRFCDLGRAPREHYCAQACLE